VPASNVYTLGFAKQTAKGTPAAAPAYLTRVTSADIAPAPSRERVEETGTGRDGGDRYTTVISVEGGAEFVCRPKLLGLVLYGVLGAKAVSGTTPSFEHVLTPADDQPYLTVWRKLANTLWEQFDDCKIVEANFSAEAGAPLMVELTINGLMPTRLTSDPVGGAIETGIPLMFSGSTYDIEAEANNAIREVAININAEQNLIQTNQVYNSFVEPGLRTIEVNYTELFQDLDRYNKTIYGSDSGTAAAEEIYHGAFECTFGDTVDGPGITFTVPNLAFMTAPLEPDPGGDPLEMEVTGEADTPDSGSIVEATLINDVASY
jgi:hypothetical protein